MEELSKSTTKQYFVCGTCKKKMETMSLNSSSAFDIFGTGSSAKAFYCDNKECDKFGYLTVAGIKVTEE